MIILNKRKKPIFKILLILILLVYFSFKICDQQKILDAKSREMEQLQSMIKEEKQLNEELLKRKETLFSDEHIERIAREKLGMVKTEEKIFIDINEQE